MTEQLRMMKEHFGMMKEHFRMMKEHEGGSVAYHIYVALES